MKGCILEAHLQACYRFVDPELWVEISWKRGGNRKGGDKKEDRGIFAHLYLDFKKVSCRVCLLLYCFFGGNE